MVVFFFLTFFFKKKEGLVVQLYIIWKNLFNLKMLKKDKNTQKNEPN
jgi:hypothetical protein